MDVPARGAETFHVPPDSELAVHVTPEFELAQEEHVDDGGYVSDEFFDDDELPSRFRAGFRPMMMCRGFLAGHCRYGWECRFAHHVSELHLLVPDPV